MDRSSMTPPAKKRPSTSSSSLASSKAPSSSQQPPAMASGSRSVRGATPTGSRPSAKAEQGDKPTRPSSKDSLKQKSAKKAEEPPKPRAEEQLKALQSDFEGLRSHLTCKICVRLLYQPYTIACGHTYCYSCLCQWFVSNKAKKTCPDCRTEVNHAPAPAYMIRDMAAVFFSRPGLLPEGETVEQHNAYLKEESDAVQQDKDNQDPQTGGLFKGVFRRPPQVRAIRDQADGVDRCPMCTWELEDGQCNQCGLLFDENGELTWGDSFAGFSDMDELSEHDMASEDMASEGMASEMDMEDGFEYDEAMEAWGDYQGEGNIMLQRWFEHGIPPQQYRGPRRRISHSEAGSRRSYSQSIISDMYPDEMDTVEEEDEEDEGDSSMNDFIDDEAEPASSTSRSASSTPNVTPQPPSNRARAQGRARRVVESETSSTISSVIEEEEEDEEDQGPIRRGQRNIAQARILNRANGRADGLRRTRRIPSSTSTDASNEQELDEDTQALLRADGWMLQHDGPDEDMDEDDMSDGGQTTVGWDATAISNDRFRMGGSLTPTADRPRPNAPIRPPSRVGNARFIDASRGLRRRSSVLSTVSTQIEDGEADDDNSDLDQDGDVAMAMNSLRSRRSRAQLRSLAALNHNNNNHNGRFLNRGFSQANPIDLDTDDNSDTSQPETHRYNPRISVLFADHQRALQEFQRPGALVDLEPRSTTPIARPRTANRNRPSPAMQYSPFNVPAPSRLPTPLMDNSSTNAANLRGLTSPRRAGSSQTSPTTSGAVNGNGSERSASIGSSSNPSSVILTPGTATPASQQDTNAPAQAIPPAIIDLIDRPPSRLVRPPSATGRRTPAGFSPVFPNFPHSNVGFNQAGRIMQNQPLRNPWGAFVQPHGVRPRNSRPVLRDQSSTATLRPVASRVNIRDNVNLPQGMRTQASRVDLRHQPSRRRLNNQASTRTLRASEFARPPQPAVANPPALNQQPASRAPRFTPDEREALARELVNDRMRALEGTQQGSVSPVRTRNPFAPAFRGSTTPSEASSAAVAPTAPRHVRSNSNDSGTSGHSSTTAQGAPSSPGLSRRRSNRNIGAAPPGALSPNQGPYAPPTNTTYTSTYFRARQGSFTGGSAAYESPLSPNGRSPMVAATGQLI